MMRSLRTSNLNWLVLALAVLGCGPDDEPLDFVTDRSWSTSFDGSSAGLLAIWGSSDTDVWAVGGTRGMGLVLHREAGSWVDRTPEGVEDLLWWVSGRAADDVFVVGERGQAFHFDGDGWTRVRTGTTAALFGVWAAKDGPVFAVGGDPFSAGPPLLLRLGEDGFEPMVLPGDPRGLLLKVWGTGPDHAFAVGDRGMILRWDGERWSDVGVAMNETLFSLWGRSPDDIWAVGGRGVGVLLRWDGASWQTIVGEDERELFFPPVNGIWTSPRHDVWIAGAGGFAARVGPGGRDEIEELPPPTDVLVHSLWSPGEGVLYAAGASLNRGGPLRGGLWTLGD